MNEHVPKAITDELRERGVDVCTVQEDGLTTAPDSDILDRAIELRRVIVTYDDDFLREASRRLRENIPFYGVIHVVPQDISLGRLIEDLEIIAKTVEPSYFVIRKIEYLPL